MDALTVAAPGVILQGQFISSTFTALQTADVTIKLGTVNLRPVVVRVGP